MAASIPALRAIAGSKQLLVDGKPFIIRAGELQNSSMSSAEHMRSIWTRLARDHFNTILGAVTWDQIEPEEGQFDFGELKACIEDARSAGLRIVVLWFGSFKNGLSTYVPPWVKTNTRRFPRSQLRCEGNSLRHADMLSLFESGVLEAETRAFSRLMGFLVEVDRDFQTVIMVQVENKVGVLEDSRDRSPAAERAFRDTVPEPFLRLLIQEWESLHPSLKQTLCRILADVNVNLGHDWSSLFGDSLATDELFMAYHYATYVDSVASAGKQVYPLPLYTNVWQNYGADDRDPNLPTVVGGGSQPGVYPSGGAVINVLDIFQLFSPSLDLIAPDIYLNDYPSSCEKYRHRNNPLFISEQRRDAYGARRIWTALASYQALGASPFGIDTVEVEHGLNPFAEHYALIGQCSQLLLEAQQRPGSSHGFFFDDFNEDGSSPDPNRERWLFEFDEWKLSIERSFVFGKPSSGYGMVIRQVGDASRFLLIGRGFQVTFSSKRPGVVFTGLLRFVEKEVVNVETGEMRTRRWLNGDETRSGQFAMMPSENPDYGVFPISITVPSGTAIAEVEPYALYENA